jgi:hypothetical protein
VPREGEKIERRKERGSGGLVPKVMEVAKEVGLYSSSSCILSLTLSLSLASWWLLVGESQARTRVGSHKATVTLTGQLRVPLSLSLTHSLTPSLSLSLSRSLSLTHSLSSSLFSSLGSCSFKGAASAAPDSRSLFLAGHD